MKLILFILIILSGFSQSAFAKCDFLNSIYQSLDDSNYELTINEGDQTPSKWAIILIKHKTNGNRGIFGVGSKQGAGGTYIYSLDDRHKGFNVDMELYQFNDDLTSGSKSPNTPPDYIFISNLFSFDWYGNRDYGEPYLTNTLWKYKGCIN
jgi:hypothetical protein